MYSVGKAGTYLANRRTLSFLGFLFGSQYLGLNFFSPGYWGERETGLGL